MKLSSGQKLKNTLLYNKEKSLSINQDNAQCKVGVGIRI